MSVSVMLSDFPMAGDVEPLRRAKVFNLEVRKSCQRHKLCSVFNPAYKEPNKVPNHPQAGKPAPKEVLIDVNRLIAAYYDRQPNPDDPAQQVVFGTSGHRGSSIEGSFNQA